MMILVSREQYSVTCGKLDFVGKTFALHPTDATTLSTHRTGDHLSGHHPDCFKSKPLASNNSYSSSLGQGTNIWKN